MYLCRPSCSHAISLSPSLNLLISLLIALHFSSLRLIRRLTLLLTFLPVFWATNASLFPQVLPDDLVPEEYQAIDVLGKTPEQVAQTIVDSVGSAAETGCVIVLCGLSGTGKGTTVAVLKQMLPNAQTWSNGNIFRSITLLCAR